jgi:hypothetical protein
VHWCNRNRESIVGLAKRFDIWRRSIWRAFLHGIDELRRRQVRVDHNVMDYSCGTSEHHTLGGNQQIDIRPRQAASGCPGLQRCSREAREICIAEKHLQLCRGARQAVPQDLLVSVRDYKGGHSQAILSRAREQDQKDFDWPYSKIPKREVLELAALRFNSFAGIASSLSPAS